MPTSRSRKLNNVNRVTSKMRSSSSSKAKRRPSRSLVWNISRRELGALFLPKNRISSSSRWKSISTTKRKYVRASSDSIRGSWPKSIAKQSLTSVSSSASMRTSLKSGYQHLESKIGGSQKTCSQMKGTKSLLK